jgi:hypothetical protein
LSEYEQTYGAAKVKEFIGEQKYNKIKNNWCVLVHISFVYFWSMIYWKYNK